MPWLIPKSDTSRCKNILAFDTFSGNFVFKARNTKYILFIGNNEGFASNLHLIGLIFEIFF